jgi:hypothetical protein
MTQLGERKTNAMGRSTGSLKTNQAMKIEGQFVHIPAEMLRSPAFCVLSLSGHRVFARVMLELCNHGGMDNGKLPVTFQDFEDYGIERHSIGPAIAECVALGLLQITHRGRSGNGEFRSANQFRLTHIALRGIRPSNEWQKFETVEAAKLAAASARAEYGVRTNATKRKLRKLVGGVASRAALPDGRAREASSQNIESNGVTPPKTAIPCSGETPPLSGGKTPLKLGGETPTGFQISESLRENIRRRNPIYGVRNV